MTTRVRLMSWLSRPLNACGASWPAGSVKLTRLRNSNRISPQGMPCTPSSTYARVTHATRMTNMSTCKSIVSLSTSYFSFRWSSQVYRWASSCHYHLNFVEIIPLNDLFLLADHFYHRWGQLCAEFGVLCGESLQNSRLRNVGERQQVQYWCHWNACQVGLGHGSDMEAREKIELLLELSPLVDKQHVNSWSTRMNLLRINWSDALCKPRNVHSLVFDLILHTSFNYTSWSILSLFAWQLIIPNV